MVVQTIEINRAPIPYPTIPRSLPKSKVKWLLIRDKIKLNDALRKEMMEEIGFLKIASGAPVGLIAREIIHDKSFTLRLDGYPLFLIADVYDGNGGAIDTSGNPGGAGSNGGTGKTGYASQTKSTPGGPGGPGQPGQSGTPASPITLIAATVRKAKLIARGGPGGKGGTGGTGGSDANGKVSSQGKFDPIEGTDGGPGGNGGNGAGGGPGAQITVHYITLEGALAMDAAGGGGGAKGAAGAGGTGGTLGGKNGAAGKSGAAGAAGKPVTAIKTPHDLTGWDAEARTVLGNTVEQWAGYRTQVGEYAFRRCKSSGTNELRTFARNELLAAMRLWSYTAEAGQLLQYLNSNLTPVGVPYDHDVLPDFSHFEKVLTDYGPLVQTIFTNALQLLQGAMNFDVDRTQLAADLQNIDGVRNALASELAAKGQEEAIVTADIGHTQGRLEANQKELDENHAEQAKQKLEAANSIIGTVAQVAISIAAVVASVYTGGASLAALASAGGLLATADAALSWSYDKSKGTFVQGDPALPTCLIRAAAISSSRRNSKTWRAASRTS